MRIGPKDSAIPYPQAMIRGKLRLCGLGSEDASHISQDVFWQVTRSNSVELDILNEATRNVIERRHTSHAEDFDLLVQYDRLRRETDIVSPVVLVLEGASATGKSLLAMSMIVNLGATRFVSTDTVRQVLRSTLNEDDYPELFCHTYQAHHYKQAGDKKLSPVVRGFLAQNDLIQPTLNSTISRVLHEGAEAVIEGVHIIPGTLQQLGRGVIEVLINPSEGDHFRMFSTKHDASGLKSVSADDRQRKDEFQSTRIIQEYLLEQAERNHVPVVHLADYETSETEICRIVMDRISELVDSLR
ncbi:MAG: hypothetical protein JSW61_07490 [Candidatus Thorarchaeota archaeon]|nr:MAG: hypothetical protein JSW61_07490 [Candidatus Thorarchaeota archaeon]